MHMCTNTSCICTDHFCPEFSVYTHHIKDTQEIMQLKQPHSCLEVPRTSGSRPRRSASPRSAALAQRRPQRAAESSAWLRAQMGGHMSWLLDAFVVTYGYHLDRMDCRAGCRNPYIPNSRYRLQHVPVLWNVWIFAGAAVCCLREVCF